MIMQTLTASDLETALHGVPGWRTVNGELVRTFSFEDFPQAVAFVNKTAELAESAGHHPDIDIRYNRVRLALVTHDAGGITQKDVDLAASIDAIKKIAEL
jgi:4a-hydroxytetrahydrobiopterin dehydratase